MIHHLTTRMTRALPTPDTILIVVGAMSFALLIGVYLWMVLRVVLERGVK